MKRPAIPYNDRELAWIRARADLPRRELHELFVQIFDRAEVTQKHLEALCKRRGWLTGRAGRFVPGQPSHNAGRKGTCAAGSEKGWFRPGNRSGAAEARLQPIGTIRLRDDGYIWQKIRDDGPLWRRWRQKHAIEWEAANGPIPAGHVLKCLDGNRQNTLATNWTPVTRGTLNRLAGAHAMPYDSAPDEVKPSLLATAILEDLVRQRTGQRQRRKA